MIRVTDITVKGAALAAVAAGDFSSLPIHNPAVECASRKRIRAIQLEKLVAQVRWDVPSACPGTVHAWTIRA